MWNFNSWNVELELSSFASSSIKSRDSNLKEANFSNGALKSEEEIKNYSLNETLNSIERAEYLIKNGIFLQKEYVYSSLVSLAKDDFEGTKNIIFPLILNCIKDESINLQRKFGESFLEMIKENLLDDDILSQFIPIIKEFLQSTTNKDDEFVDLWILILNEMIPILSEETISNQLVSEMKTNIDLSRPTEFREMCARIMGTLSGCVKPTILETIIFPKIVTLCQDTLYEIRKYMSEQLNQIFKNLRFDSFMKQLMSEYIELIIDEEDIVSNTALQNVIDIIPDIAKRLDIEIIYPTLKTIINEQSNKYFNSIKEKIGLLIWNLKDFITTEELQLFINYYISVAMSQNEKDCVDFIYNLPCIAFISEQLNYEKNKMYEIINFFCQNKNNSVRLSIAKCFHVLTSIYGKESYENLSTAFLDLLKDNDIKVLETIFKNMSNILGNFSKDPNSKFNDIAKEIVDAYQKCKNIAPLNWRAQKYIVKNFENFPNIFNMDIINNYITPLIFNQILDNSVVKPIKQIFCRTLLIYIKKSKRYEHRDKIHTFLKEMKQSQNYHIRYLFLEICYYAVGIFSSKYFCEYFLYSYIDLYRDPIPNIRIYLCQTLMPIRHCLFLFNDLYIIQKFNIITNSLIIQNSDDVDLNNTNNIIKDILNYSELQKNNKYVMAKSFPKDIINITLDFFLYNDKYPSKRNSLKPNTVHKNSLKPKVVRKSILDDTSKRKNSSNEIETSLEITGNKKSAYIDTKKFILPDSSDECYKNIYLTEIYKSIDEINYDNLISEDQIKEKEENGFFRMTSEQIKENKKDLLEHFKCSNINQFEHHNNKLIEKSSNENISKSDISISIYSQNNGANSSTSSIKNDHSVPGKGKMAKYSTNSSIKYESNYSSQKYKKLGDEKSNLKPKISGNTQSGKQPIVSSISIKKKADKSEISYNSKKKTSIKNEIKTDISKKKIEKSSASSNYNAKTVSINDIKKKKPNKYNVVNYSVTKKNTVNDINNSLNTINVTKVEDNLINETMTKKLNNSNLDVEDNINEDNNINSSIYISPSKSTNSSSFLSPSKSSSIWSSSSSITLKSNNSSVDSTVISEPNSAVSFPPFRDSSINSVSSTVQSISPPTSISSIISSVSGKNIQKKKNDTNSSVMSNISSKSKITFDIKSNNSNSSTIASTLLNRSNINKATIKNILEDKTLSSKTTSNTPISRKIISKTSKISSCSNSLSKKKKEYHQQ
ncbi:ARM repeat-containing protein [Neocallimastix californiae]|uniref:ARM repeat-containing protein n=1 Tax=Neocallimastix californiae TaxID=1754190 RepID=A0A1Y2AP32_9FUNG|nr:ARM repeat-containing protein [Neocallimastix californiae]|eukprot:ORY23967.1 ARM repeat-containing protein [Neocallimastix californiae]